ncbi:hypothetical protein ACOMHN_045189 [Nucella lapillus]
MEQLTAPQDAYEKQRLAQLDFINERLKQQGHAAYTFKNVDNAIKEYYLVTAWCRELFSAPIGVLTNTAAGCGGLFSGPTGVLKSPGHPGPYPRNQDCVYVIRRPDTDRVTLAFHELDLEKTDHCVADSLEIRDGDSEKAPVRYRGCGSNMPMEVIRSFSSAFWIRFTSDEADTAGGFKITYTADPALRRQFFLLSHQQSIDIKHVGEGGSMALPIPGLYNPVALEFDPRQRRVYWSDQGIGEIRSAFLNGTDWKTEYTHTGDDFSAVLALDPMARLVFFGNLFQGTVVMRSLDTGHHRTVLSGLGPLASLVLDYSDGTLFWVESSVLSSSISRSLYDGSQRRQIVTRHLGEPRCLALDREHKRLYWVDLRHEKVEWSDYEGKGRSSQVATFQGTYFFAIVVSPTHLHVLDWGDQGRYSKYSVVHQMEKDGSNDTALFAVMHRISDLHFLDDAAWKAETNGCGREEGRGGCSHLCIPLSGQGDVRCVCPDRFLLSADHKTCTPLTGNEQSIRGGNYYHADFEDQDDLDDEDDDEAVITLYSALNYLAEKTSVQYEEYIAQVSLTGPRPFETDGSKVMPVTCQYEGKGIRSWRSAQCVELKDKVCLLQPKVPDDDGKEIMCEVHFMDGSYGRAAFTIRLNYPPQEPPRIKGYNSGQILKTGDNLHMSCVVHGGKPLVSSVDFYCPGHLDTEPDVESRTYVQASVTIDRLTSSHDGVTCVCSAEWKVPEMYAEKAYVTLRVVSREKTEL